MGLDYLLQQHISTDMDDQLVRRGFFSRISHMFKVCLNPFFSEGSMILDIDYLIENRKSGTQSRKASGYVLILILKADIRY
jgi:hypothetical protein